MTTRQRVAELLLERGALDIHAIRDALPDVKPDTIGYALWDMVRQGEVRRSPGGRPLPHVRYTYAYTLDDDGWVPQPWRHPYARAAVAR